MLQLPNNIKLIRQLLDITQADFGKKLGATKAMIISYEKGKALPNSLFITRLANAAGLSEKDLTNRSLIEDDIDLNSLEKVYKLEKVYPEATGGPNLTLQDDGGENYLQKRRALKSSSQPYTAPLVPAKAQAGYVRSYDQMTFLDTLEKYALPPGVDYRGAIWRYFEIEGKLILKKFVLNLVLSNKRTIFGT